MAKMSIEEKAHRKAVRSAQRFLDKEAAFALKHPDLARYYAGSIASSIARQIAAGGVKSIVAA